MRWIRWTLGFIAGLAAAAAFEVILLGMLSAVFQAEFAPRRLGWFVFPIGAGLAAGRFAMAGDFGALKPIAPASSAPMRFAIAAVLSWWICVLAYLWIAVPYGSYAPIENAFDSFRIAKTMKWLIGPPLVVAAIFGVFRLAARAPADRAPAPPEDRSKDPFA